MLTVIGIGPGSESMMTQDAIAAIREAEIIVGYKTYTHLVKSMTLDKQVIKTGMCKEIERCQAAIDLALAGHNVALISSGDAGILRHGGLGVRAGHAATIGTGSAAGSRYHRQYRGGLTARRTADA